MSPRIRRPAASATALAETIKMLGRHHRDGKIVALVGAVILDHDLDNPKFFIHSMSAFGRTLQTTGMAQRLAVECGYGYDFQPLPDPQRIASELRGMQERVKRRRKA